MNEVHTSVGMNRESYLLQHSKSMNIIPNWYEIYTSFLHCSFARKSLARCFNLNSSRLDGLFQDIFGFSFIMRSKDIGNFSYYKSKIQSQTLFLNQKRTRFLKIVSVRACVRVRACVCPRPPSRLLITSGMMWTSYIWLTKFYSCYTITVVIIVNGYGLGIGTLRRH